MKNGNESAFPVVGKFESTNRAAPDYVAAFVAGGLSKREYFAIEIAKGLASATNQDGTWTTDADSVSTMAIEYADALLAELEKEQ